MRLLEGVPCALAGRTPGDIDMVFVRENSEGEYSGVGGRAHQGHPGEVGIETAVFTRAGIERVVEHAFHARRRAARPASTSATKSNASRYGYVLWDEVAAEVAARHPGVRYEHVLVDALAARMVLRPDSLDVIVASNLFGDILTDLGAAIQGGMGMAASANLCPDGDVPGLFEPVHGSAPDIAGQGIANPCGAVWSAVLMLDHLGEPRRLGASARRARGRLPRGAAHARPRRLGEHGRGRRGDPRAPARGLAERRRGGPRAAPAASARACSRPGQRRGPEPNGRWASRALARSSVTRAPPITRRVAAHRRVVPQHAPPRRRRQARRRPARSPPRSVQPSRRRPGRAG